MINELIEYNKETIGISIIDIKDRLGLEAKPSEKIKTTQKRKDDTRMNFFSAVASARPTDLLLSIPAALWR